MTFPAFRHNTIAVTNADRSGLKSVTGEQTFGNCQDSYYRVYIICIPFKWNKNFVSELFIFEKLKIAYDNAPYRRYHCQLMIMQWSYFSGDVVSADYMNWFPPSVAAG
jgi:hypothetical protein